MSVARNLGSRAPPTSVQARARRLGGALAAILGLVLGASSILAQGSTSTAVSGRGSSVGRIFVIAGRVGESVLLAGEDRRLPQTPENLSPRAPDPLPDGGYLIASN